MNIENLILRKFVNNSETETITNELLSKLIEYRAMEKDYEINRGLLKDLVLKYSEAERKLVELNELKNKFLGIAAHDLRNPLAAIMSFSEIILEEETGPINEEQREFLDIIHNSSKFMLSLLNDLLDVSMIESGKLELKMEKGSLKNLIIERVNINKTIASKKNIDLKTDIKEIQDTRFDANRIAQVVDNLISNAIKFSERDSKIYVTLSADKNKAVISVKDEGPGISKEDQVKLFNEFQKLTARPTAGEKSTGLGLAIVKKIIDAHKGNISVDSELGKGTTFYFTLPLS